MDKLDKESILKNAKISDKQTRKFAYGITTKMIITYVNEHKKTIQTIDISIIVWFLLYGEPEQNY